MIECLIRYYFKTAEGRIVRFERSANFPTVPFVGSQLSLKGDNLEVEYVVFCEEDLPILVIKTEDVEQSEIQEIMDEMKGCGWSVASDACK